MIDRREYAGILYQELLENGLPVAAVAHNPVTDNFAVEWNRTLTPPEVAQAQEIRGKYAAANLVKRKQFFVKFNTQRIILAILEKLDTGVSADLDKIQEARRLL